MQKYLVLCVVLLALASADECPDGGACEEGSTCCKVPSDGYECCPLHQAECCEDHLHCCPQGTVCAVDQSLCVNATVSLPWMERVSAKPSRLSKSFRMISASSGDEDDNVCSDQSRCPAEFSCLKALKGYSCCPLAQGVPCADGKHCCSEDHHCSIDGSSCIKQKEESEVGAVMCSDGESECPDGTTCCETPEGGWGCCPMPKAVCCEDKAHCCPEGSTCDIRQSKCISSTNKEMPMWAKFPARKRAEWENKKEDSHVTAMAISDNLTSGQHPETTTANTSHAFKGGETTTPSVSRAGGMDVPCDGTTACEDGTTCCKTKEGGWACCPLPEAVCCDDFIHCCPHGKKCNMAAQKCEDPSGPSVAWVEKVPAVPRQRGGMDVPCDGTTACEDGTTCCKTKEGGWACCPLPEAVCCDDFIHCCPHGKKCNLAAQTCEDPSGPSVAWVKKVPAVPRQRGGMDVPCDGTTACEDGTTCCKTKEGGWACCPLPEAVCCDDFIHCCPHGKKCNMAAQKCEDPSGPSVAWVEKVPAVPRQQGGMDVPCDGTATCEDGTTCCKTKEGGWACCPLPEAVCCDDFIHCCPHGKKCNLAVQTCEDPSGPSVAWVEKVPAVPRQRGGMDVPCDGTTACEDGTTCCKTKEGGWACCPLPEAVCCDDFIHCCPHGKKCNMAAQKCEDPSGPSVAWVEKVPAVPRQRGGMDVPCDGTAFCQDGTTCCKNKQGNWACCPLPEAVCCADHETCCPHGTTCNQTTHNCDSASGTVPMVGKVPALTTLPSDPKAPPKDNMELPTEDDDDDDDDDNMVLSTEEEEQEEEEDYDDEEHSTQKHKNQCDPKTTCPKHTTCCFMRSSQKWGCCPLPEAVCCADGDHCCPKYYTCNDNKTSCLKGKVVIPWYNKLAAESVDSAPEPTSVKCDAQNRCPEGSTCCQLATGQWGCCPLPKAVCCVDQQHCCPLGFRCNVGSGTCQKLRFLQVQSVPLTKVSVPEPQPQPKPSAPQWGGIHCGGRFNCKSGETCCQLSATTWGCCPYRNAVCCSDMMHCCPTGLTCGKDGTCSQPTGFNWDYWQVFFSNKRALVL